MKGTMPFPPSREGFPVTKEYAFLNHAAVSPLPRRVVEAIGDLMEEMSLQGMASFGAWMARVEEVRGLAASLVGAKGTNNEFQAIIFEDLERYAAANGFQIFILNESGEIQEKILPSPPEKET